MKNILENAPSVPVVGKEKVQTQVNQACTDVDVVADRGRIIDWYESQKQENEK